MPVLELVKWHAQDGVSDPDMAKAVDGILPDLKTLPGFISQTLYKDNTGVWVDVYLWETEAQAVASNDLMADKPSFIKLISLVKPETITIEFLYEPDQS